MLDDGNKLVVDPDIVGHRVGPLTQDIVPTEEEISRDEDRDFSIGIIESTIFIF